MNQFQAAFRDETEAIHSTEGGGRGQEQHQVTGGKNWSLVTIPWELCTRLQK